MTETDKQERNQGKASSTLATSHRSRWL